MSISSALASALSGIKATSRQAEAISSNVANATTPGYGRRSVALTSLYLGGAGQGVRILGTERHSNPVLLNDRRMAQAAASASGTSAGFLARLESLLGTTGSSGGLVERVNALDSALLTAAAHPESETGLEIAVRAATALAGALNSTSKAVQAERLAADKGIAGAVQDLNTALAQVAKLNTAITASVGAARDPSSLMDQRQQIVDSIADLVPLRQLQRDDGQIALITTGGAVLLDGTVASLGFSGASAIVAELTLEGGGLSGLTLNGRPIEMGGNAGLLRGGHLAALFEVRDSLGVTAQARLDGMARDLVERFSQPGLDASLAAGAAGLFTDAGAAFDPLAEIGLAGRISVHSALDAAAGGTAVALRAGLGLGAVGPSGDPTLLLALSAALGAEIPTASTSFSAGRRSVGGLAGDMLSSVSAGRVAAQAEQAFGAARHAALADLEHAEGVDVDQEMQALLVVEKNYAANAKVMQAVDEMLDLLLGL